jgi:hypothetical protein
MLDREERAFRSRVRKLSKVIGHADLTSAVNGQDQDISLGQVPAGAVILGGAFKLATQFTGGAASSVSMIVGFSGDTNGVIEAADVFGGATGAWSKGTQGTGVGLPRDAATTINANFDPDVSHTLAGLDAGSITVEVYFYIPDADQSV